MIKKCYEGGEIPEDFIKTELLPYPKKEMLMIAQTIELSLFYLTH